jgi:hypothetical protein
VKSCGAYMYHCTANEMSLTNHSSRYKFGFCLMYRPNWPLRTSTFNSNVKSRGVAHDHCPHT